MALGPQFDIRSPAREEMPAVFELRWQGLYMPLGLSREELKKESHSMDENPRTIHVAAFVEGKPVSTVRIEPHPKHGDYVSLMATDSAYRDQGLGRAVLGEAENRARGVGINLLKLHAAPDAVGFYEKKGYRKNDENVDGQTSNGTIIYTGMEKTLR